MDATILVVDDRPTIRTLITRVLTRAGYQVQEAEDHAPGSALGPLLRAVVLEQFHRLRAGDHYWYENDPAFSPGDVATLRGTKLSDVIKRNTEITNIQANVVVLP